MAKEDTSMPINFRILSPKNRNSTIMTNEAIVAFSAWMNPTLFLVSMMTGKEPMISITAKRIIEQTIFLSLTDSCAAFSGGKGRFRSRINGPDQLINLYI